MSTELLERISKVSKTFTISKVDYEAHVVYGIASSDALDVDNEIVDPASVRACLADYLEHGTVRYMHQEHAPDGSPIIDAVGKVFKAEVDQNGRLHVWAKVLDPLCWAKIKAGILRGFSIAGDVTREMKIVGGKAVGWLQMQKIGEITLCDNPANPEAKIKAFKMQGPTGAKRTNEMANTTQKRKAAPVAQSNKRDELAGLDAAIGKVNKAVAPKPKVQQVAKAATPDKLVSGVLAMHNDMLTSGNADGADMLADAAKLILAAQGDQGADMSGGDSDPDDDMAQDAAGGDMQQMDGSDDQAAMADLGGADQDQPATPDDSDPSLDDNNGQNQVGKADEGNWDFSADNSDQDFAMDGTEMKNVTSNGVSDNAGSVANTQPDAQDPVAIKVAARVRAKYQGLPSQQGSGTSKSLVEKITKFAEATAEANRILIERVEKLEAQVAKFARQPRAATGPVLTVANDRSVTKGMSDEGSQDAQLDALISQARQQIAKMTNPTEREMAQKDLAMTLIKKQQVQPVNPFELYKAQRENDMKLRRQAMGFIESDD